MTRALLVIALAVVPACAGRSEAHTRHAFDQAKAAPRDKDGTAEPTRDPAENTPDRFAQGWERVGAILEVAVRELGTGERERVLSLAARWCATPPTPQDTGGGPVVVCHPEPPIVAGGHKFTLEMGERGMVGLVARDLAGRDSQTLVQAAQREGHAWCVEPWRSIPSAENAFQEFSTCSVAGGAVLTVGRLPQDLEADLWQVSVTLLGAT